MILPKLKTKIEPLEMDNITNEEPFDMDMRNGPMSPLSMNVSDHTPSPMMRGSIKLKADALLTESQDKVVLISHDSLRIDSTDSTEFQQKSPRSMRRVSIPVQAVNRMSSNSIAETSPRNSSQQMHSINASM